MISVEIASMSSNWETFGKQILLIEQEVFAEKAFSEEMLRSDISDSKAILAVLKNVDTIIGFAYALPEEKNVSCVVDIAISKDYQKKGLVAVLTHSLEAELKKNGYEYITEHAMVENGYADKITKNYSSRIIETRDFVSEYGKQRYFKIRL